MAAAILEAPTMNELVPHPTQPLPGIDRIVLTGFMGSGKTTAGGLLAQRLGWAFVDLDREIERRDGRAVAAIFAESGEEQFRRLEASALAAMLGHDRTVVALGGGALGALGNRLLLEQTPHTAIVYLAAPLETLADRCAQQATDTLAAVRPLFTTDRAGLEARFAERHPLYERLATHRVDTAEMGAEAVAAAVMGLLLQEGV